MSPQTDEEGEDIIAEKPTRKLGRGLEEAYKTRNTRALKTVASRKYNRWLPPDGTCPTHWNRGNHNREKFLMRPPSGRQPDANGETLCPTGKDGEMSDNLSEEERGKLLNFLS